MVRHIYLFSSVTFCPIFPYVSSACFLSRPLLFPSISLKSSLHTMPGDFCICLLLSSDSIPLLTHWFYPLAYPKLIPLKCILSYPLWELPLLARTILHNGGYRHSFSVFPVCLFSMQSSIGALLFSHATLRGVVMPIPDFTTDLSEHFTLFSMSWFSLKRNWFSPNRFPLLSNTVISLRWLY